jgi:hypothetical protein
LAAQRNARSAARHLQPVVACDAVCEELPLVVDGSRRPSTAMAEHLRNCPRCQAEMSSYQRLLHTLRSLKDEPLELTAGVVAAGPFIVERLVAQRHGVYRRPAEVGWGLLGRQARGWPWLDGPLSTWALAAAFGLVAVATVGIGAFATARRGAGAPLGGT